MSTAHEFASAVTVEELDRDPYPIYARLRNEAPVCLVPAVGLWFVTRWADVEEAATRPDVFAARVDPSPGRAARRSACRRSSIRGSPGRARSKLRHASATMAAAWPSASSRDASRRSDGASEVALIGRGV